MKPKQLLIYFILFTVIGAFVYFYEYKGGQKRDAAEKWAAKIFKVAHSDSILAIKIHNDKGTVSAHRVGKEWKIDQPFETNAENSQWNSIANHIASAAREREITTRLTNLATYGLDKPRATVTFTKPDNTQRSFLIGAESKASKGGAMTFVKWVDSTRIVTTTNILFTQVDKSLFDLRDKTIFSVDASQVAKIEMEDMGRKVVVEKIAGHWLITDPVKLPALSGSVNSAISSLNSLRALEFIEEHPVSLKPYGLNKPIGYARFTLNDSSTVIEVRLGNKRSANEMFVQWTGDHPVAIIDTTKAKYFVKSAFDFQDKKLKPFDPKLVNHFTVVGDHPLDIVKRDTLGWFSSDGDTLSTSKVESLIRSLNTIQADEVGAYNAKNLVLYGLQAPRMTVTAYRGKSILASLLIGTESGESSFAKAADSPNVYKIRNWRITGLKKTVKDLKN